MNHGFTEDDQTRIAEQAVKSSQTGRFKGGLGFHGSGPSASSGGISFVAAGAARKENPPEPNTQRRSYTRSPSSGSDDRRDHKKHRREQSGRKSKVSGYHDRRRSDSYDDRKHRREREHRRSKDDRRKRDSYDASSSKRRNDQHSGGGRRDHSWKRSSSRDGRKDRGKVPHTQEQKSKPGIGVYSDMTPAEILKLKVKRKLEKTSKKDDELKPVMAASKWERSEMAETKQFFAKDEYSMMGAGAGVAAEVEMRGAMLTALEDDNTQSMEAAVHAERQRRHREAKAQEKESDPLFRLQTEVAHHDAIFAPLSAGIPSLPESKSLKPVSTEVKSEARNRERDASKRQWVPVARDRSPKKEIPLWKSLKMGEKVEAQYTVDDLWYPAEIKQVIHGGYPIAKYKVLYTTYGNSEEISWKRIKRLHDYCSSGSEDSRAPSPNNVTKDDARSSNRKLKEKACPDDIILNESFLNHGVLGRNDKIAQPSWKQRKAAAKLVTSTHQQNTPKNGPKEEESSIFLQETPSHQIEATTIHKVREKIEFNWGS